MNLKKQVDTIRLHVDKINEIMSQLYKEGVEIRIQFKDSTNGAPNGVPCIELWRATHHVDLLKSNE